MHDLNPCREDIMTCEPSREKPLRIPHDVQGEVLTRLGSLSTREEGEFLLCC